MVCCAVVCSSCGSSLSLGGHSTSRLKEVVYTPDDWPEALPAHLYQPESESPTPAVLLVHGGSWALGDDRYQMSAIARRLAKRGYLVMNVTYRMTPEWFFPDPVDDLKQALAWLRSHAGELNVDAGRIGLFGYSAGGQLVAMLGLAGDEPGVRAIVAGSTPHDMTLVADEDVVKVFLRGTYEEYPDGYRAASPLFNVTVSSPSMFLYHGTRDDVVVPEHSVKMQRELARKGIPHELHWVKGRGHVGTFLFPGKAMDHAIDFLDRELSAE
ncbi:alpha/beta hydrolase [Verrucomicrobiaceae bacterium R5-34]|uniref:Alpha/beta hydrolase n=1 Tax=Oceaniferula flava TaxID=2800421 RepID=A0AAE2S9V6_9BACT|nr:alpha/beta hydrolase [Oceaniferula flavus]MBK1831588.1 alpha/beta hydrolase [Verrucomicrobiaceae bacterium R5-34]MBK1854075.1 alpha/beta hydrolase [Oceaniferula flavus]MBM1135381.1 alpha/beta hydrolase [Oceaniferula flavus]